MDNDVPALFMNNVYIKEGDSSILTITRNAGFEKELAINIYSDNDAVLEYEHTVQMQAGAKSVDVEILAKVTNYGETDITQDVSLYVNSDINS